MYCSSCGRAIAPGLTYCNHCGARLSGTKGDDVINPSEWFPESLVWAIVAVFIVGLGSVIGLMAIMKQLLDFSREWILAITLLSFTLMFAVEGVLISLLLRQKVMARAAGDAARLKDKATRELSDEAQPRALHEPAPSITEQTTRAFEPVYTERKSE